MVINGLVHGYCYNFCWIMIHLSMNTHLQVFSQATGCGPLFRAASDLCTTATEGLHVQSAGRLAGCSILMSGGYHVLPLTEQSRLFHLTKRQNGKFRALLLLLLLLLLPYYYYHYYYYHYYYYHYYYYYYYYYYKYKHGIPSPLLRILIEDDTLHANHLWQTAPTLQSLPSLIPCQKWSEVLHFPHIHIIPHPWYVVAWAAACFEICTALLQQAAFGQMASCATESLVASSEQVVEGSNYC